MANLNLLSSTSRIEVPYIKVTIGDYTFGVYNKKTTRIFDVQGTYTINKINYPNYIQSLNIKKINGSVNTYTLVFVYAITENVDPNFFEKVFSSVSSSRKIVFSYGDMALPSYIYKNEEAIIKKVTTSMNAASSTIQYTVSAVSSISASAVGSFNFNTRTAKPSDIIKEILYNTNDKYGLLEIFYGMRDKQQILDNNIISSDDNKVIIKAQTNISILNYLNYLVSCMTPLITSVNEIKQNCFYVLSIVDDITGKYNGPYFKVSKVNKNLKSTDNSDTYEIDIGYPTQNIVTNFSIVDDESFSIFYDYNKKLNTNDYSERIDDNGGIEYIYNPTISSNSDFKTHANDKSWWTQVTQFPIKAQITIKGLLRPAILMTYIRLNVYFYGVKHLTSGLYIITQQIDTIDFNGYKTVLSLTRVGGDNI